MAQSPETLPEGTDRVLNDATDDMDFAPAPAFTPELGRTSASADFATDGAAPRADFKTQARDKAADLRGQATDKARQYALVGKDKATDKLEEVVRMISDTAATIDDKVGPQYGDYARRAADAVAGLSSTLREKDVDELFVDAREAVRKSPAIAIGAAAALGFVIARLVKAAGPVDAPSEPDASKPSNVA